MSALFGLILLPIALAVVALLGYFIGIILVVLPIIGDLLTVPGVSTPTILAWVFVIAFMIAMFTNKSGDQV